jgi:CHAT domain-containing protein
MNKWILLFVFVLCTKSVFGQLSVTQLESEWIHLYQKGLSSFNNYNYKAAAQDFSSSIDLLKTNGAQGTLYHVYSLIKLAETYYILKDNFHLEKLRGQITDIKTKIRPGSKTYIHFLYNLSIFYSNTNQFDYALKTLDEALSCRSVLDEMEDLRVQILHRIAMCNFFIGNTDEAISYEKRCIDNDNSLDPNFKKSLVFYYYHAKEWPSLEKELPDCFKSAREASLRFFSTKNARERSSYWSTEGLFFTDFIPAYLASHPSTALTPIAYDAALFSKGILLAAENKTSEIILNSNDPEIVSAYQRFLDIRGKKNKSIEEKAEFITLSETFLQYQKDHKKEYRIDFRIGWQAIKEKLGDNDIAIEFIIIPSEGKKSHYAALTLRNTYTSPHYIDLGEIVFPDNPYKDDVLYAKIWKPLENDLDNVENIYFSPIGELCNTGLEYLMDDSGTELTARFNLFRLSSTKEIVLNRNKAIGKCTLFGGINYDTPLSVMAQQTKYYDTPNDDDIIIDIDSLELRDAKAKGVSYLKGSEIEVSQINEIMNHHNVLCELFNGDNASETTFKNMSGGNSDVLHIATHGFYYANRLQKTKKTVEKLFRNINLQFRSKDFFVVNEEKMLTRSGLLLAGVNNILRRISLPKGVEDGVLYAEEISHLDLSHINLLVLSACQSGLGDIASSEGVFGLQRGFKRAGVKSIVMSLWKVDDKATEILMTEFYKNLSKKETRREALFNAQLSLRTFGGGMYDDPKYWAAFILLDGMN